jgi:hypothetical protein
MTTAQALMEARALRRLAAEIDQDNADMARTLVRVGEESNWTDSRLELWETELRRWEAHCTWLIAQARALENGVAA